MFACCPAQDLEQEKPHHLNPASASYQWRGGYHIPFETINETDAYLNITLNHFFKGLPEASAVPNPNLIHVGAA
jgi:hypothetical protein